MAQAATTELGRETLRNMGNKLHHSRSLEDFAVVKLTQDLIER